MNSLKQIFAFCSCLTFLACHGGKKLATVVNGSGSYAAAKGTAKVNIQAERLMGPYNFVSLYISTAGNLTFHLDSFNAYGSPAGFVKFDAYHFLDSDSKDIDTRVLTTGGPTKISVNVHIVPDLRMNDKNPKMAVPLAGFITYEGAPLTTDTLWVDLIPPASKTP